MGPGPAVQGCHVHPLTHCVMIAPITSSPYVKSMSAYGPRTTLHIS